MHDFRREQRHVATAMAAALAVAVAALTGAAFVARNMAAASAPERIEFALRAELFVVIWLAAAIADVARLRFFSERDIAGAGADTGSDAVKRGVAVLQNTLEQVVLAALPHLIFAATFARSIALLPVLVGLFSIGRLLFWIGYHRGAAGRAFGFALTFYPSLLALLIAFVASASGRA